MKCVWRVPKEKDQIFNIQYSSMDIKMFGKFHVNLKNFAKQLKFKLKSCFQRGIIS